MNTETFDIRQKHRFNLHLLCHSITVKTTVFIHGHLKASLINQFLWLDGGRYWSVLNDIGLFLIIFNVNDWWKIKMQLLVCLLLSD